MTIKISPGPNGALGVVEGAVNDLMVDHAVALAAGGEATQVSQPIPRFLLKLDDLTDTNFLAKAAPIGWRYLILGPGPIAVADVKEMQSGTPSFDSLIHGEIADRLAKASELAEHRYGTQANDFEARILEIPSIHMSALWLHGPQDIFIPIVEKDPKGPLPPREDPSFILRAVRAAATKRSQMQKGESMLNPVDESELQRAIDDLIKAALQLNETARQLSQIKQSAPPVAVAAAAIVTGGQGASAVQLTADQRLICERVINAFETGSMQGDYSNITIFPDGPNGIRQVTYGRAQTTEYGNLRELVQMYVNAGGEFSNDLRPFVDRIGRVALVDDSQFKDLLHRAGAQDQVMRNTQDVFFDRRYFQPALNWAQTNGFSRALSVLVIYDSFIHSGGILDLLRSRFPEAVPARGGNEQSWTSQYVSVRNDWLQNNPRQVVRASAYRTRDLLREIGRNNWDLSILPISANGVQVDARPLAIHLASAAGQPVGVPYFAQGISQADAGIPDADPAAPLPGEADDLTRGSDLANFGEGGALDLSPLAGAAGVSPTLKLDMSRVRAFLQACETSTPRVTYGLGKKVPFLGAVPGRDFTKVDCSGFIREALRLATTPPMAFPDGSVNQHDWIRAQGFAKSTVSAALQSDSLVRIAFLRPQDTSSHIGHVVLVAGAKTLESHGGVGPDSRTWTGAGWQASTFVYILAPDTAAFAAGGGAMLQAAQPATFTVHTGRRYRATLGLRGIEQFASNDMVAAELQRYGFVNVSMSGSGGTRYAEGTWSGADTTAQLDAHIVSVVEIPTTVVRQFA